MLYKKKLSAIFLGVLAAFLPACGEDKRPVPKGPSVLVITAATLRSDYLGCYGAEGSHTPNIDKLADKGTLFENCTAPIATTFPSHASMFTSLYPRYHGVRWNGHCLNEKVETLAEVLEKRGWDTAAFVAYKAMLTKGGFDQGFRTISDTDRKHGESRIREGREVNAMVKKWLSERDRVTEKNRPFFLWVHYFEPHSPYSVTPYAAEAMEKSGYEGPFANGANRDLLSQHKELLKDPVNRQALRELYTGCVIETDELVGELIGFLKARGLEKKTMVFFAGGHGQMLGESLANKRHFGHGAILYEPALRVPLIIKNPAGPTARRISVQVGLIDLMPTVLDMVGLKPRPGQGRSLREVVEGGVIKPATYMAETRIPPEDSTSKNRVERIAVYSGGLKVIFPGAQVYDLSHENPDTGAADLIQHVELVKKLDKVVNGFIENAGMFSGERELDEEDYAGLRELGYIK